MLFYGGQDFGESMLTVLFQVMMLIVTEHITHIILTKMGGDGENFVNS